MILSITALLRDLEAFLRYVTIIAFHFYLLTSYIVSSGSIIDNSSAPMPPSEDVVKKSSSAGTAREKLQ